MKDFLQDKVQQISGWVVPDRDECRHTAEQMVARAPGVVREKLARELIRFAQKRGATVGGLTGIASSPLTMVPAALADIAAMLRIEGIMVGGVAALLDPESLDDPDRFHADVLAVVFPAAISQALRQVGIRSGEQLTKALVRRVARKEGLETMIGLTGRILGSSLTTRMIATKGVPIAGIGIGAGWNWVEASMVGQRAIAYHTGQPMGHDKLRSIGRRFIPESWQRKAGWRSESNV